MPNLGTIQATPTTGWGECLDHVFEGERYSPTSPTDTGDNQGPQSPICVVSPFQTQECCQGTELVWRQKPVNKAGWAGCCGHKRGKSLQDNGRRAGGTESWDQTGCPRGKKRRRSHGCGGRIRAVPCFLGMAHLLQPDPHPIPCPVLGHSIGPWGLPGLVAAAGGPKHTSPALSRA